MGSLIDADILIAELKESASHHCNNPREDSLLQRDRVIVRAQPTVEAIPREKIDEMIAEIEDKICSFNYFASEVTTRDAILKIIHKYCDKEQKNE